MGGLWLSAFEAEEGDAPGDAQEEGGGDEGSGTRQQPVLHGWRPIAESGHSEQEQRSKEENRPEQVHGVEGDCQAAADVEAGFW